MAPLIRLQCLGDAVGVPGSAPVVAPYTPSVWSLFGALYAFSAFAAISATPPALRSLQSCRSPLWTRFQHSSPDERPSRGPSQRTPTWNFALPAKAHRSIFTIQGVVVPTLHWLAHIHRFTRDTANTLVTVTIDYRASRGPVFMNRQASGQRQNTQATFKPYRYFYSCFILGPKVSEI